MKLEIFPLVIMLIVLLFLFIIPQWKINTKAGKPGWAILIPIYSTLVRLEMIGKPWWWILIMFFVPIINIVFLIWFLNLLVKSFGKGVGFTIGMILLPFIFIPILGYGSAEYKGPAGATGE